MIRRQLQSPSCRLGFRVSPQLVRLEDRCTPTNFVWTNKNGGFWDEKTNWEPQFVPNAGDTALINAISGEFHSGTIIVRDGRSISAVADVGFGILNITTFPGATLSVGNDCSAVLSNIQGTINVSGKQTAGVILAGGTLSATQLTGGSLNTALNSGSSTFAGIFNGPTGSATNGVSVANGSTLSLSGATLNMVDANDAFLVGGNLTGSGTVNCSGTVRVVGSVGGSITTNFSNATIEIVTKSAGSINGPGNWSNCTIEVDNFLPNNPAGSLNIGGQSMSGTMTGVFTPGSDTALPINTGISINNGLTVPAAGLTLDFPTGMLRWTGGVINGSAGTLTNKTALDIAGPNVHEVQGGTFDNQGAIVHTGSGNFNFTVTGKILNAASASYDLQSDADLNNAGGPLTNAGLFKKSGGSLTSFVTTFHNAGGVVDIQSGTFETHGGSFIGGTINVAANAVMIPVAKNSAIWTGTIVGSGAGRINHAGGALDPGAGSTTINFTPGLFHWLGGTINPNDPKTFTNAGSMTLSGPDAHTIGGFGTIFNTGSVIHRDAGTLLAGGSSTRFVNKAGATYELQSDTGVASFGALQNEGLFRKTAGAGVSSVRFISAGGTVDVQTGTVSFVPRDVWTGGTFNVATGATLIPAEGTATAFMAGKYSGSGGGQITHIGGSSIDTFTSIASFDFAPGLFQWLGGQILVGNAPASLTNLGSLTLSGAANRSFSGILTNAGTIIHTGTGNLSVGTNKLDNLAGATYELQSDADITGGALDNAGLVRKTGGAGTSSVRFTSSGGTVEVETGTLAFNALGTWTGGVWNVAAGATLIANENAAVTPQMKGTYSGTGGGLIRHITGRNLQMISPPAMFSFPPGLFQWEGGAILGVGFNNAGAITLSGPDGRFFDGTLSNTGTITHTGTGNLTINQAILANLAGGSYDFQSDADIVGNAFNNSGLLRKTAGSGVSSLQTFTNTGGTIDVQTGTLDLPGTLTLNAGILRGHGTVLAPVTNGDGSVRPGSSPGKLTVNGGFTQGASGNLTAELNGIVPGIEHDQLAVIGAVSLSGTLTATFGFPAKANDSFIILDNDGSDTITGTFTGLTEGSTVSLNNGGTAKVSYKGGTGNDVTLTVVTPPSAVTAQIINVQVNDGSVQRSRVTSLQVTFNQVVSLPGNAGGAFQLKRQGNDATVGLNGVVVNGTNTVVTLTFTGGAVNGTSLVDGRFTLTALASQIVGGSFDGDGNGTSGDDFNLIGTPANGLFRLFGDADGNGTVNGTDFLAFRLAFLGTGSTFDFDGDGQVSGADFLQFRLRFLQTI